MNNKKVFISFVVLIISILYSYIKIEYNIKKNIDNNKNIVRYGNNVKEGDIININSNRELVIKILEDGSYITKIIK